MAELSMREFKKIVRQTMETLPEDLRPYLDNLVVDVADEPDHDLLLAAGLTEEEIKAGESLLGLFEPVELGGMMTDGLLESELQHRLWIFKKPHEEEFKDPVQLRTEVRKTVIHELAHHFGWSDRDLERFDATPDPFADGNTFPPRTGLD
ncbi:metallopeptidase family protein [Zavarzinella formosa]|uniref:metallopeptidase family protein n=1 Tax=Zavarzinella formosa TaxID=360055 RepID=UPI0012FB8958|nr:metallopeptidase family protein [Zavarzinella formosa]